MNGWFDLQEDHEHLDELALVDDIYLSWVLVGDVGQRGEHHEVHQVDQHQDSHAYSDLVVRCSVVILDHL